MSGAPAALTAPFPWFGGKRGVAARVWQAFGQVKNYVEPFAGSAAVLLAAPEGERVETLNDLDGFVVNFWRAVACAPDAVAHWADWPVTETDLFARHLWLMQRRADLVGQLEADPAYCCPQAAGWWLWGQCAWIGSGWCSPGSGPWRVHEGRACSDAPGQGVGRQLPHLGNAGQGVHGKAWRAPGAMYRRMQALSQRLRHVRIACGQWQRVLTPVVTANHGQTAVFLDPPYTDGNMDYAASGCGGELAAQVRQWCMDNGHRPDMRIVLCGRGGEHDALLTHGWTVRAWRAHSGYARQAEAKQRAQDEKLWCSPACLPERAAQISLLETAE